MMCQANVVFAVEFARRYGDKGIISTAVNPGRLFSRSTPEPSEPPLTLRIAQAT